jgi:hypothetical protein
MRDLISQNAISSSGHGGLRKLPSAFIGHGAVMAANILHTERAKNKKTPQRIHRLSAHGEKDHLDFKFVVFSVKGRHFFLPEVSKTSPLKKMLDFNS